MLKVNENSVERINTLPTLIVAEVAEDIRRRDNAIRDWLTAHKVNSYEPEELSKELGFALPTNDERSALEVYDFVTNPPERYFLYISESNSQATTWTGQRLGRVTFGRSYRSAFGDARVPVWIDAVNGVTYHGTFYKSAGDYARIAVDKKSKR